MAFGQWRSNVRTGDGARDHEQPERRYRCKRLVAWSTGAAKAPSRIYHNGSLESLMLSFTNYSGLPRFRVTAHSRPTVKIHYSQIRANLFSDFSCTYKDQDCFPCAAKSFV